MIPLIILSFITVGMAELGKKANRLFGLTLLLAYGTTVISGLLTFFIGKAVLLDLFSPSPAMYSRAMPLSRCSPSPLTRYSAL